MLTCGSVFSGIGLLDYGLSLAGIHHAWLCERDEWRRGILAKRWPGARVLDDVRHVGHGCEPIDLLAGGFPCKGASTAGKRNGFDHAETVLWREMARAVGELRPRYVLVENVANILALHDGAVWGEVLGDLAAFGYDTVWDCLPAGAVGAPHLRDRVFAVATDASSRPEGGGGPEDAPGRLAAEPHGDRRATANSSGDRVREQPVAERRGRSPSEPANAGEAPADAHGRGGEADAQRDSAGQLGSLQGALRHDADGRGVRVEWGDYEPAIRRWEAIHGPAPEPLVSRVDARGAARVERSRLSALGDGVQVQVGMLAGAYIVELEAERQGALAA